MALQPVPRIAGLDRFSADYFVPRRLVVISDAARLLPAFSKWTDEHLLAMFGTTSVPVKLANQQDARIRFADYWRYLFHPEQYASSSGAAYFADYYIRPTQGNPLLEALSPDISCPLPRGDDDYCEWISLYAGPTGTATPMHKDPFSTSTWMAMLRGRKRWRLCEPRTLDPFTAPEVDVFRTPQAFDVYDVTLEAGDLLFVPPDWWHQVQNIETSLAVSGNFCSRRAARANLEHCMTAPIVEHRDLWIRTWTAVLEAPGSSPTR